MFIKIFFNIQVFLYLFIKIFLTLNISKKNYIQKNILNLTNKNNSEKILLNY